MGAPAWIKFLLFGAALGLIQFALLALRIDEAITVVWWYIFLPTWLFFLLYFVYLGWNLTHTRRPSQGVGHHGTWVWTIIWIAGLVFLITLAYHLENDPGGSVLIPILALAGGALMVLLYTSWVWAQGVPESQSTLRNKSIESGSHRHLKSDDSGRQEFQSLKSRG